MILFDLRCPRGHAFEGWFRDGAAYEEQARLGVIACAVCGDTGVSKALMAPAVSTRARAPEVERETAPKGAAEPAEKPGSGRAEVGPGRQPPPGGPSGDAAKMAKMMGMLRQVQAHIQQNFEHVGRGFSEEARKMHLGEAEKRSIYGEATAAEAEELRDEGIEVAQIPWLPRHDA